MNIACWNVRTLLDDKNNCRPERRTALVACELKRYNIDIAALAETHKEGDGQLEEVGGGYTFFWKGKPKEERREAGVGFAIRSNIVKKLKELPVPINERLMTLRLHLKGGRFATLISAYAPTLNSCEETKITFYTQLRDILNKIPRSDKIILLGDFNARVGTDWRTWNSLGRVGVGKMNSNGLMLLELCEEHGLYIASTHFRHKDDRTTTWMHPRSKVWHLLDYVIIRKRDIYDICNVKSLHGSDCWTDHSLVRAKFRLMIRRKERRGPVSIPRRMNVHRVYDAVVREKLQTRLSNIENTAKWEDFRDQVLHCAVETLGYTTARHRDWFDENDVEIQRLLVRKRHAHNVLLHKGLTDAQRNLALAHYSSIKSLLQRSLRRMQNTWWEDLACNIQAAADANDSKRLYQLMRRAVGPKSSTSAPLLSKDSSTLFTKSTEIASRWTEHFSELLNRASEVDETVIDTIQQRPIIGSLNSMPSIDEVTTSIGKLNLGRAPGKDGICAEILRFGGTYIIRTLHELICAVWRDGAMPKDWKDAIILPLYKGKGARTICGSYRGIALLSAAGKVLANILLARLTGCLVNDILSESQCGFRSGRGTMDMIFTARQLQEKCYEQNMDLVQVFIDLTKAFDTVNRMSLWKILGKLGCPDHFVSMIRYFHDGMEAWVNIGGDMAGPIPVENGVKQGDILAPTLFSLYFAAVFTHAFAEVNHLGIYVRYRSSGRLFNIRRFSANTKVFQSIIRDLLYADDCDLVTHTVEDMQTLMNCISASCKAFGLSINLDKTVVMFQPAPGNPYVEPAVFVEGTVLKVVDKFVYLGSTLSRSGSLDDEISFRLQKATNSFRSLQSRVWSQHGITRKTKVAVYRACVLTSLLYSSETWTLYKRHVRVLERFHQRCLRHILNIGWASKIPDTQVLETADVLSIEAVIHRHRLRWTGHLIRMKDNRIPKQMLYGELVNGKRPQQKPRLRFKDCVKASLKDCVINDTYWESSACHRSRWRRQIRDGVDSFERVRISHEELKRAARKRATGMVSSKVFVCNVCGRVCMSKAGLISHQRSRKCEV